MACLFERSGYGCMPNENASHDRTPNAQMSEYTENLLCWRASGDSQRRGRGVVLVELRQQ